MDNLLVTPDGGVVLVECKLQRNLQARREVIAQIMDYAAQLQSWSFDDLDKAVRRAELPDKQKPAGLLECFNITDDSERIAFEDAITRNLRRGRMLLLVVGDGIREGLESLASILQQNPGFHAALGLVELKLYSIPSGGYIVQPRTLLRTLNIERGIVTLSDDRLLVVPPHVGPENSPKSSANRRPASLTEEEFYEILGENYPEAPEGVKKLVNRLEEMGLVAEFKRSLIARWIGGDGREHNVMNIRKRGWVSLAPVFWTAKTEKERSVAMNYLQNIANALGAEVYAKSNDYEVWVGSRTITVQDLLQHEDECVDAVAKFLREFQEVERSEKQ